MVTTAVTHAEIKHYTYVGIHNECMLASTVIELLFITKPNVIEKKNCIILYFFFFDSKTEVFDTIFCYT